MKPKARSSGNRSVIKQGRSRDNVADQPGFWFAVGICFVAWAFGAWTRSWFDPEKFRSAIQTAARQAHKDLQVSFDSIGLSLADGWAPSFAVSVKGMVLSSQEKCWLSPTLEVQQLRLPINFFELLSGKFEIETAAASDVQLTLRSAPKSCAVEQQLKPALQKSASAFRTFKVDRFQVNYLPLPLTTFNFEDLNFDVRNSSEVLLTAGLRLTEDTLATPFASAARFSFHYFEDEPWKVSLIGSWREASYEFVGEVEPRSQVFRIHGELKHFALGPFLSLLRKYHVIDWEVDSQSSWISFTTDWTGSLKEPEKSEAKIHGFRLEGELGDIRAETAQVGPSSLQSADVQINSLQVDRLFPERAAKSLEGTLGALGSLRGRMKVRALDSWELTGELSGLEVLLSGEQERWAQPIAVLFLDSQRKGDRIRVDVNSAQIVNGSFLGRALGWFDVSTQKGNLKLKVDDLMLSNPRQQLAMGLGTSGLSGEVNLNLEGDEVSGSARLQSGRQQKTMRFSLPLSRTKVTDHAEKQL